MPKLCPQPKYTSSAAQWTSLWLSNTISRKNWKPFWLTEPLNTEDLRPQNSKWRLDKCRRHYLTIPAWGLYLSLTTLGLTPWTRTLDCLARRCISISLVLQRSRQESQEFNASLSAEHLENVVGHLKRRLKDMGGLDLGLKMEQWRYSHGAGVGVLRDVLTHRAWSLDLRASTTWMGMAVQVSNPK